MTAQGPLIVPMVVEAFVVNDSVRLGGTPFIRTQMQYNLMQYGYSAQPVLSDNDLNFLGYQPVPPNGVAASAFYDGVYLKWRLPWALTQAQQVTPAGGTASSEFPYVPNRWLVVRYNGPLTSRTATAWIIQSDALYSSNPALTSIAQGASQFMTGSPPAAAWIGQNISLGSWTEPNTSLGLTAVGAGNPAFAFYQPHCNNVFSLVDTMGGQSSDPATLSYMVFGWYSAAANDPLAAVTDTASFAETLAELGWGLPSGTDSTLWATWSLIYGTVGGVQWQNTAPPPSAMPDGTVAVAVGNTSIEALTALVTAQSSSDPSSVDPLLLEAFQLDALTLLDQPDGAATLEAAVQGTFFQQSPSGYVWSLAAVPGAAATSPDANAQTVLDGINAAQTTYDTAVLQLDALQMQLYQMWWKTIVWPFASQGVDTSISGLTLSALQNQLDSSVAGSLAAQVAAQATAVTTAGTALQTAISSADLPAGLQLMSANAPPFYLPNNPVVLLSGAGINQLPAQSQTPMCRFPQQLVTEFTYDGSSASASNVTIPQPDLSGVSGVPWSSTLASALVGEFFLTDPSNAMTIASAIDASSQDVQEAMGETSSYNNVYPTGAVASWTENPWHPLLLIWQAQFYPIAYETGETANWTFLDGAYLWNGAPSSVGAPMTLQGVVQLAPSASLNMLARLETYITDNANDLPADVLAELQALVTFVQNGDNGWDLLSQGLNGFNEQLRLCMPGLFPVPSIASSLGNTPAYPAALANVPTSAPSSSPFQALRGGQFYFNNLLIVDEWGQALWPISPNNLPLVTVATPPEMAPVAYSTTAAFAVSGGPFIASINPTVAAVSSTPFTLTVTGVGFDSNAQINVGGSAVQTTFVSATQVTAQITPSSSGALAISVSDDGLTTSSLPLTVASGPVIASLSPAVMLAGSVTAATFSVTIAGIGFGSSASVQWNGTTVTSSGGATQLVATVPASSIATPGTATVTVTAGSDSAQATFTIAGGAVITSLNPAAAVAGSSSLTLTVTGLGFSSGSVVQFGSTDLATTFVDDTSLTAVIPSEALAAAGEVAVIVMAEATVVASLPDSLIQLAPALIQPAQVVLDLVPPSATASSPIAGWVIPNHLDQSILAYDGSGNALGEMAVRVDSAGGPAIVWTPAPGTSNTLQSLSAPIVGPFLLGLSNQDPATFAAFLSAIDNCLWTTVPMNTMFDQSLATLIGRPLALVNATLQLYLDGSPYQDPSWQYAITPATPAITGYAFAIELGNVPQVDDGVIGYFSGSNYELFNIVQQSGAVSSAYLAPIGINGNYIQQTFASITASSGGSTAPTLALLVDPYGSIHATTGILPQAVTALDPQVVGDALSAINISFRVNSLLADPGDAPLSIRIPLPAEESGAWSWQEYDDSGWTTYTALPSDSIPRLTSPAVLRNGFLQLTSPFALLPQARAQLGRRTTIPPRRRRS